MSAIPQVLLTVNDCRAHLAFADGDLEAAVAWPTGRSDCCASWGSSDTDLIEAAVAIEGATSTGAAEIGTTWPPAADGGKLPKPAADVPRGRVRVLTGDEAGLAQVDAASRRCAPGRPAVPAGAVACGPGTMLAPARPVPRPRQTRHARS